LIEDREVHARMKSGLDILLTKRRKALKGKRIAVMANETSVTRHLAPILDALAKVGDAEVAYLYGLMNGLRGESPGYQDEHHVDEITGLAVYPSYSLSLPDAKDVMREHRIDAVVFDAQNAGARYFEHKFHMCFAMEAAAQADVEVVILDRPNPLGGLRIEGEVLDRDFRSVVGYFEIPNVHGMTHGELARMFNDEHNVGCDLTVLEMEGWRRSMWYEETGLFWTGISPNLPKVDSVFVYAGTCLFEGTNLSVGRGTTSPFEVIGAPWLDAKALAAEMNNRKLPGVKFGEAHFVPSLGPSAYMRRFVKRVCRGVRIYVTNRKTFSPVRTAVHLLDVTKTASGEKFKWTPFPEGFRPMEFGIEKEVLYIDTLAGSDGLRNGLTSGIAPDEIVGAWEAGLEEFRERRRQYLLYR